MNNPTENKIAYVVKEVIDETPDIKTLKLTLEDGTLPEYIAGQFITVYFPESQTHEGKAYTFSSAPHESTCNITVKRIGEFSEKLCDMKKGDSLTASLPYGFFSSEYPEYELVLFASGIGITPFRSIILDCITKNPEKRIRIYHSNSYINSIPFKEEFKNLIETHQHISIVYHITRDLHITNDYVQGRIDIPHILASLSPITEKEFLICGSIAFVRDTWKKLKESGVDENFVYTEAFFK